MDTEQIERLLAEDSYTKSIVVGVLAKDCLPKTGIVRYPAAFVCNTQASDKYGQHWMCMFFTNENILTLTAYHLDKGNSCIFFREQQCDLEFQRENTSEPTV